jgi:hypothetical protein
VHDRKANGVFTGIRGEEVISPIHVAAALRGIMEYDAQHKDMGEEIMTVQEVTKDEYNEALRLIETLYRATNDL